MIHRAALAGLLAIGSLLVGSGSGAAAGPASPAVSPTAGQSAPVGQLSAATSSDPITLRLGSVTPTSLDADHDLVVKGSLRNPGPELEGVTLRLRLNPTNLGTRDQLDDWMGDDDQDDASPSIPLPGALTLDSVGAGSTKPFTLTVPAGDTGLADAGWAFGPRGLTVQLSTGSSEITSLRTLLVWAPDGSGTTTRFSMLVPMTSGLPSNNAGVAGESNAQLLSPGGRLDRVLAATSGAGFDWAIDPAVLQAASRLGTPGVVPATTGGDDEPSTPAGSVTTSGSPGSSGTPGPTSSGATSAEDAQASAARSWLARFEQALPDRVALALPYADTDLNSVLDNGQAALLRTADQVGKQVIHDVLGTRLDRTVAWPADGTVSSQSVAGLSRADRTDVVIAASAQPPTDDLDHTPTGRSTMQTKSRSLGGLLYDDQLSTLLADSGGANSAVSTQWMLAELAAIGMERPGVTTHVLAVAPRTWNPEPKRVQQMTAALRSAPWVSLSNLDRLRQQDGDATARTQPRYTGTDVASELPAGQLTAVQRLNDALDLFAPAALDAKPQIYELRERLASLLSVSWRGRDGELSRARLETAKIVNPVATGVHFLAQSSPLFLAQQSNIYVYVQNETDFGVKVRVELTPRSGQLRFDGAKDVQVSAHTRQMVLIGTKALAGGDVDVEARMFTSTGGQLGMSTFRVRVRPNWERVGMIVGGSVLGLLLVIGLLRSIRRGRTRIPPESVPDVDDIAAQNMPDRGSAAGPVADEPADVPAGDPAGTDESGRSGETGGTNRSGPTGLNGSAAGPGRPSGARPPPQPAHASTSEKKQ